MPEGPTIVILKEQVLSFKNKVVKEVEGNSKLDIQRAKGKRILDFKSWGKHFLICFNDFSIRIHFMLFGSYTIDKRKETIPRLRLIFAKGEISFYACSVKIIEESLDEIYDWSEDIMNDAWDPKAALKKLHEKPEMLACDAVLDQHIFSGAGNIFKNEVLWRTGIHPLARIGDLPNKKLKQLVNAVHEYAFDFLRWKKEFTLRKHWDAHTKKTCPRCHIPFQKEYPGKTKRRSFFCEKCQMLYE